MESTEGDARVCGGSSRGRAGDIRYRQFVVAGYYVKAFRALAEQTIPLEEKGNSPLIGRAQVDLVNHLSCGKGEGIHPLLLHPQKLKRGYQREGTWSLSIPELFDRGRRKLLQQDVGDVQTGGDQSSGV